MHQRSTTVLLHGWIHWTNVQVTIRDVSCQLTFMQLAGHSRSARTVNRHERISKVTRDVISNCGMSVLRSPDMDAATPAELLSPSVSSNTECNGAVSGSTGTSVPSPSSSVCLHQAVSARAQSTFGRRRISRSCRRAVAFLRSANQPSIRTISRYKIPRAVCGQSRDQIRRALFFVPDVVSDTADSDRIPPELAE